jgi:predicted Zn-dependent protease
MKGFVEYSIGETCIILKNNQVIQGTTMNSNAKPKIGLNIQSLLKDDTDSGIILSRNNNILRTSINSPNNVKIIESSKEYLPLWNLKPQPVKTTESNTFAAPITIATTSGKQFQEALNPVPENSPDAIYAPGTKITKPESFVNSGSKWSQPGGKNTLFTITYSYDNLLNGKLSGGLTNAQITGIIREAVGLWSKYAPINFVEVSDSGPAPSDASYIAGNSPQIRFGTHNIDGSRNVLAHAYYPYSTTDGLAGDIHFDSSETWKASPSGGFDLLEVAVHELGHALGLDHESTQTAIMNPYYGGRYSGSGSAFLFQDDINGIQDIYGTYSLLTMQRWATRQGGFWDAQQWLVGDFNGDGKDEFTKAFNDQGFASVDVYI